MDSGQLRYEFHLITGIRTSKGSGMPDYLCYQCSAYLKSCKKFRDRCQRAHYALQQILNINKEIKKTNLRDFNRSLFDIMPSLSLMNLEKAHYEQTKFQWTQYNRLSHSSTLRVNAMPIFHCSTLTSEDTFNTVTNIPIEIEITNDKIKNDMEEVVQCVVNSNFESSKEDYLAESTSNVELVDAFMDNDETFASDAEPDSLELNNICKNEKTEGDVDGSNLDEEYAMMIPISVKEAKAAIEVYKMFSHGKFNCEICNKAYFNENRLKVHMRMHDKHISGTFHCGLCNYYYKTEYLLKTHMTEKHMYKYVCRKCPDVNFDRTSAKQHYIWSHLQKGSKKDANWYESRPSWLSTKGGKRVKGVVTLKPVRKLKKVPKDFLLYSPIQHEEQYALVQERQNSRNYKEAKFKCNLCYRGFREMVTYSKHMKKHNPEHAGPLQCDMCKLHFMDQRRMYKHMNITHLFKYSCQMCTYVCYNRGQAQMHYRWHKNVKYQCPHCKMEFVKASTRLTHIRIKHPSMNLCNLCGHSFVSETGLYCHKQIAHTKEEIELCATLSVNESDPAYCADCNMQFVSEAAFNTHLGSSYKHASTNLSSKPSRRRKCEDKRKSRGRPRRGACSEIVNNGVTTPTTCEVCNVVLANDVQARKHYESEHPDTEFLKRYMCDVCGHTTRQYANLLVHMRTHTDEKPYECPHCDRRFNMPSNRDRHLVVHTGEKRYQCQHCNRRFTQSSACKLHIQTVHFKIPYAPWNKKNRKRRKELETANLAATSVLPTQHKLTFDTQGDYLNAYITYNDE
ncbi:unnamed protein product [Arctia plantaginis]|uniref:Uncharacterized protein n=1 Tax=Arctia plantaginis TaxID=874455 RepID=A0A8S0Z5Y7_ARCPL|nr:unnamed protein product [Arctia plantaginis]